jgi:CBS-domain-containing membrane protein
MIKIFLYLYGYDGVMKTLLLRLIWVLIGSTVAITLALWITKANSPLMLASLGGTTLFLFALTTAPAAQPRAVFGAHLISSLVGILSYQLFGDAFWVYIVALVVTIGILLLVRCVHPPAGANPLIMIQAHAGFIHLGITVLVGVSIIFIVAYLWSRVGFGVRKYPLSWVQPSPPSLNWSIWDI